MQTLEQTNISLFRENQKEKKSRKHAHTFTNSYTSNLNKLLEHFISNIHTKLCGKWGSVTFYYPRLCVYIAFPSCLKTDLQYCHWKTLWMWVKILGERMQERARGMTQAVAQMQTPSMSYLGLLNIFVYVLAYLLMLWGFVLGFMCVHMHVYVFSMQAAWIKMTVWCLVWISGLRVKQLFIPPGWHKQTQIQLHIHTHTHTHTHFTSLTVQSQKCLALELALFVRQTQ